MNLGFGITDKTFARFDANITASVQRYFRDEILMWAKLIQQGLRSNDARELEAAGELLEELSDEEQFWNTEAKRVKPVGVGSFARGSKDAMAEFNRVRVQTAQAKANIIAAVVSHLRPLAAAKGIKV